MHGWMDIWTYGYMDIWIYGYMLWRLREQLSRLVIRRAYFVDHKWTRKVCASLHYILGYYRYRYISLHNIYVYIYIYIYVCIYLFRFR